MDALCRDAVELYIHTSVRALPSASSETRVKGLQTDLQLAQLALLPVCVRLPSPFCRRWAENEIHACLPAFLETTVLSLTINLLTS